MPGPGGGLSDIDHLTNAAISAAMAEDRFYGESPNIGYKDVGNYVNPDGVLRWADGQPFDPPYNSTTSSGSSPLTSVSHRWSTTWVCS